MYWQIFDFLFRVKQLAISSSPLLSVCLCAFHREARNTDTETEREREREVHAHIHTHIQRDSDGSSRALSQMSIVTAGEVNGQRYHNALPRETNKEKPIYFTFTSLKPNPPCSTAVMT